jgi:hypothetical protein
MAGTARPGERRAALDALKAERSNQSKAPSHGILVRAKAWMEMKLEQAVERIGGGRIGTDKARPSEKGVERETAAVAARKAAAPVLAAKRGRERDVGVDR